MDDRTRGLVRDGTLALVALVGLDGVLRRSGETGTVRSLPAALLGVVGALAVEAAMLRYPELTRALWERPSVQAASLVGLLAAGRALTKHYGAWTAAACWWGLVAYLGMLACVLAGLGNPVAILTREPVNV